MSSYYDNYIVLGMPKDHTYNGKHWRSWDCELSGMKVGRIEFCDDRAAWEKAYLAEVCAVDRQNLCGIGYYDTLIEAKKALFSKAIKYIESVNQEQAKKSFVPAAFLPAQDVEFYPTPQDVAGKLFAGVEWRKVHTILEPSAGKGDLLHHLQCMQEKNRYRRTHFGPGYVKFDIDCIEIDDNLRAMLIGKGYRVVHDDFLTFHSRKCYDLILMNPPFSNGDLHLLHAMDLIKTGGQIACILNAETVLNPFSNARKTLVKQLHRYGATIKIHKNAFDGAERKADVDIAIITVSIPAEERDNSLWEGLRKARQERLEENGLETELAPANNVERLIREYIILCETGIDLIKKYNGIAPHLRSGASQYDGPIITLDIGMQQACIYKTEDVNRFLQIARGKYWRALFDLPELREKMTSDMKTQYDSTINEMRDYEFSEFNIQQVLNRIMGQLNDGVEAAIYKCFDKLSAEHAYHSEIENENIHYYNGWKTNKAHYVNMKCIIPTYGCFARGYRPDKHGRYRYVLDGLDERGCFEALDDLEKALNYLDKGETVRTDLASVLRVAAANGRTSGIDCTYFEVKFYKKGTCHIKFYDRKIVDRLNIFVGRKRSWLPPTYGKVRYKDMDAESQRVVNEFEGQQHYEQVMQSPQDYIVEAESVPLLA